MSLTSFYIYENAAIVKSSSTKINQLLTFLPVVPDTSIRRLYGNSIYEQGIAIRNRIFQDTCKLRAYPVWETSAQ